jgi:hypothetical protein
VASGTKGTAAYSTWFGRLHRCARGCFIRSGIRSSTRFALRTWETKIKHALLGWSGIPAKYGAKDKAGRFRHRLAEAVANVVYTGLDLSHITKRHGVETEIDPND